MIHKDKSALKMHTGPEETASSSQKNHSRLKCGMAICPVPQGKSKYNFHAATFHWLFCQKQKGKSLRSNLTSVNKNAFGMASCAIQNRTVQCSVLLLRVSHQNIKGSMVNPVKSLRSK